MLKFKSSHNLYRQNSPKLKPISQNPQKRLTQHAYLLYVQPHGRLNPYLKISVFYAILLYERNGSQSVSNRLSLRFIAVDVVSEVFYRFALSHVTDRKNTSSKRKTQNKGSVFLGVAFVFRRTLWIYYTKQLLTIRSC